ncbi:pentapeptide repeat-containing protein [Paenibacillus sp. D2_2]|uniref:pentapeptide repeat-containing protein n=1 Tax=Paenibacillus sp. D2_2 TaxID=3073092 RepID=UPI002815FF3F|nr:pentapeptide repeat-containing protein [Paenibacillus sp. D2_2]WMT43036.1 pentapeptide repeat-containing protein [Paenibacillus sp. D2_2]
MEREKIKIVNTWGLIETEQACLDGSIFIATGAERLYMEDVSLAGTKITNANLSNLEIDGAQLGGAYFHNIGIPREGDFHYNPDTAGKPVRFEHCELVQSSFTKCDLRKVEIHECKLEGMRINGILVEDLLNAYAKLQVKNEE